MYALFGMAGAGAALFAFAFGFGAVIEWQRERAHVWGASRGLRELIVVSVLLVFVSAGSFLGCYLLFPQCSSCGVRTLSRYCGECGEWTNIYCPSCGNFCESDYCTGCGTQMSEDGS